MWRIDTLWFDAAVVLGIFAAGNILFGHFVEHMPKWRRLLKAAFVLAVVLALSATAGRAWAYGFLALLFLAAAYVHLVWLPKHGINGWTAEPRERPGARHQGRHPAGASIDLTAGRRRCLHPMDRLEKGRTVYLRRPVRGDVEEFLSLVSASRGLHRPWVYPPSNEQAFYGYADRVSSERFLGCFICLLETGAIVGVANLSEIVRGIFQSAYLGFYSHTAYSGRGLMREGLQLLLRHAFHKVKLHRIEANVQPENSRSLALVRALGFRREGFSPKYLKIGGRWRDHERWALLAEDFRPNL